MLDITAEKLAFRYPDAREYTIKGLNCGIKGPKTIGLLGTNGSGKTTFIKLLAGLLKPTEGKIIVRLGNEKKRFDNKTHIGYVPENAKLFLVGPTFRKDFLRLVPDEEYVDKTIASLGLEHLADKKLYHLSEGQRRLIAHVLVFQLTEKKLLLIDEPTIGLDANGREMFIQMVDRAVHNNQTVIISTNDPRILPKLQYLIVIGDKKIQVEGTTKRVLYRLEDETPLVPNQIVRLISTLTRKNISTFPSVTSVKELNELLDSEL
ncbi:MAG: energy-coupling factor ABC transporter ATP-binding protein [Candidatus Hodarchaeales archaeon]